MATQAAMSEYLWSERRRREGELNLRNAADWYRRTAVVATPEFDPLDETETTVVINLDEWGFWLFWIGGGAMIALQLLRWWIS